MTHHATHATTSEPDPRSLIGNPKRMFPTKVPLNADAIFAEGAKVPETAPYPFIDEAGPQNAAEHAANQQCWLDFDVVTEIVNYQNGIGGGAMPDTRTANSIAFDEGVTFTLGGVTYKNKSDGGKWSPTPP